MNPNSDPTFSAVMMVSREVVVFLMLVRHMRSKSGWKNTCTIGGHLEETETKPCLTSR